MSRSTTPEDEPVTSDLVGRWQVGAILSGSGTTAVFLARHSEIPTLRGVLKVLRPPAEDEPADFEVRQARFQREAAVLSKLRHRGCPQVLDSGNGADGAPFMVHEHLVGDTLLEALRRDGPQTATVACRVVDELADILIAARRLGVAHRDVKPENIVLAENGAALVGWGIAMDGGAGGLTQAGLGTLAYVGPEEFGTVPSDPWKREVYALGVVLVECLTGETAFPEATGALVARKLRIPYLEAPGGCSPAIVEAIHAATRRDPDERVDLDGLRALVAPLLGSGEARPSTPQRPAEAVPPAVASAVAAAPRRRSRAPSIIGAFALLATVLWLGVGAFGRGPSSPPGAEAAGNAPPPPEPDPASGLAEPPTPPLPPTETPPADAAPEAEGPRVRAARRAVGVTAAVGCTGGVELPEGKWRLRPRAPDSEQLVRPSHATPCGKYKLMGWNVATRDWDARKNVVVRKDRVLTCDKKLRCSVSKR